MNITFWSNHSELKRVPNANTPNMGNPYLRKKNNHAKHHVIWILQLVTTGRKGHKTAQHETRRLVMMVLHISQTTILAHSWLVLVKAYELNRMTQCRVTICSEVETVRHIVKYSIMWVHRIHLELQRWSQTSFTNSNPVFYFDWWNFIDQFHWRLFTRILGQHPKTIIRIRGRISAQPGDDM